MAGEKGKSGGGQGHVRSYLGHGRMVRCSGRVEGRRCQRAIFFGRGIEGDYDCGAHVVDKGKAGHPVHKVSPRRKMLVRAFKR